MARKNSLMDSEPIEKIIETKEEQIPEVKEEPIKNQNGGKKQFFTKGSGTRLS